VDPQSHDEATRTKYFVYKLVPPRPTFNTDMSEAEAAAMGQHFGYWQDLVDRGIAVVYGPVQDPDGVWGLAVVAAGTEEDVHALGVDDPAVKSGISTFRVYPMPDAVVRS
jgi:hypothetical protein